VVLSEEERYSHKGHGEIQIIYSVSFEGTPDDFSDRHRCVIDL